MKEPRPIEIEEAQVEQLIRKAERGTLDAAEQKRLVPLLKTLLWLQRTLLETRISLSKLKRILFGKKTEKRSRKPKDPDPGDEGDGSGADEGSGSNDPAAGTTAATSGLPSDEQTGSSHATKSRGHGRRAAADYPGATTVCCTHDAHRSGIGARCANGADFAFSDRWCACVLPVSHWHWSRALSSSSCVVGRAVSCGRPRCHPRQARKPMMRVSK